MMSEGDINAFTSGTSPVQPGQTKPVDAKADPMKRTWNRYAAEGYNIVHNNNSGKNTVPDYESAHLLQDDDSRGKGCTQTNRQLTALLVVCLLLIVGLSVALAVLAITSQQNVCDTPDCVIIAGTLLSKMDQETDPCDDFYKYSCGAAISDPMVPPDQMKWGVFNQVAKRNNAILKRLLDTPGNAYMGTNSTAVQKAKDYYHACMDMSSRENIGTEPLFQVIKELGSWPILPPNTTGGTWDASTWSLESTIVESNMKGGSPLFQVGVGMDDKNSSRQLIQFDQGGLMFTYTYYIGNDTEKYKDAFVNFFVGITGLLGASESEAKEAGKDIWDFETALAKARDKPEDRTDPSLIYHVMTVKDIDELIGPRINLKKLLSEMFNDTVPFAEDVLVYAPEYLKKLAKLLSTADDRTLANYMVWQVVSSLVPMLPMPFRLYEQQLYEVLYGVSGGGSGSSWESCVASADSVLGFATGALYVEHQFTAEDRTNVENILELIRKQFEMDIPKLTWMDGATKLKALEKAAAVLQKIGYPDFIKDVGKLDEYYQLMTLTNDSIFHNVLNARWFSAKLSIDRRGKETDKTEWHMTPAEVNAYYNPGGNEIVFPAGILQKPFYDEKFLRSLMFGGVGMVMGHELTHAFDNQGRMYDKDGNLNNWWTNKSAAEFTEKTKCLVDEYSQFKVEGSQLNGLTTLGENIADNGGTLTALKAYHKWLQAHGGSERTLPGLDMDENQLFFLSFAQLWCAYYTPEYAKQSLVTDVHSNTKYRVIGVLKNMEQFSDAFSCPPGAPMNPTTKCHIW